MPDPLLTAAIKEAYASAPVDTVVVDTIELSHPAFTAPIRVVLDHTDLTATLEDGITVATFQAFAFRVEFPEMGESSAAPEFIIKVDGVSREIAAEVDLAVESGQKVQLIWRAYLLSDPSGPQNSPRAQDVIHIHADVFTVEARAALPNAANTAFPREDYTAPRFPGLAA